MSKVETNLLCDPELLSEVTLREILHNSCIDVPLFKSLNKDELIEIFKRIAVPLPQREYNVSRNLGKQLNDLREKRGIEIASCRKNTNFSSTDNSVSKTDSGIKNRQKPCCETETEEISKKMRLSNSCHNSVSEENTKRKIEVPVISESNKRQKITWP